MPVANVVASSEQVTKDTDMHGYAVGLHERAMTVAAQPPPTSTLTALTTLQHANNSRQGSSTDSSSKADLPPTSSSSSSYPSPLSPPSPVIRLLDSWEQPGTQGGKHSCLVLEQLGDPLTAVLTEYGGSLLGGGVPMGLPLPVVRRAARRLLAALHYLHR